jgi:parvulin-like peptidyl-prolyl isomerase
VKRRLLITLSITGACAAGVVCGELLLRLPAFRNATGILFKRGHLLALAHGQGIYDADLRRALAEWRYAKGIDEKDRQEEDAGSVKKITTVTTLKENEQHVLTRLISNSAAQSLAADEKISKVEVDSELKLLREQFRDEKTWRAALQASGFSVRSLRWNIVDDLRARECIEQQMISQSDATEDECRNFYDTHPQNFMQRARFRASHLFLAAPPETPPEVVESKEKVIKALADRIRHGEKLGELAAAASEDEATKTHGGDLGFFSESRTPPDFLSAIVTMRVGEISQPIRTRLGFHIVELTDFKPARQMNFEEVQPEIRLTIKNEKRRAALHALAASLLRRAKIVRPL